jgi:uncharacterized protein YndB with AHSA1/START domain
MNTQTIDKKTITIETIVNAPIEKVWQYWNEPEHITKWAFASDDWEAPHAENDLKVGGTFKTVMSAKDKSQSFDFGGTYTAVNNHELIEYEIGDGRKVSTTFSPTSEGVKITQTFEIEGQNSEELQRNGWQAILDNFKKHTE